MERADIKIDSDEQGFYLVVVGTNGMHHFRMDNPEELYDQAKARIGPWLRERDEAAAALRPQARVGDGVLGASMRVYECDPDESGGYNTSDPKHPDYHSVHADIWDAREGK